jgi:hypothetical protein
MKYCFLDKYKNMFGEQLAGIHKYRFLDTAIVDYVLTIALSMLISKYTDIPLVLSTIIIFSLGIFMHVIFGVETKTVRYLGLTC